MNVQLKGDLEENKNIFTRDKKEENSMLEGSIVKALILFATPHKCPDVWSHAFESVFQQRSHLRS